MSHPLAIKVCTLSVPTRVSDLHVLQVFFDVGSIFRRIFQGISTVNFLALAATGGVIFKVAIKSISLRVAGTSSRNQTMR
jgi:hypothetical protein